MTETLGAEPNLQWFFEDTKSLGRVGRDGECVVFEWPDFLRIRIDALTIEIEPSGAFPIELLPKVQKGAAPALARYVRGGVAFHGSAVSVGSRGIIFVGPSGAGKSTTAALMCADGGAALLADDAVAGELVNGVLTVDALEDAHWLYPDAAQRMGLVTGKGEEKRGFSARRLATAPVHIAAIVALGAGDQPHITRLRGRSATRVIVDAMVRVPIDTSRAMYDFAAMGAIADAVPVYGLLHPQEISANLQEELVRALAGLLTFGGSDAPR